jgi:hypothetical protein
MFGTDLELSRSLHVVISGSERGVGVWFGHPKGGLSHGAYFNREAALNLADVMRSLLTSKGSKDSALSPSLSVRLDRKDAYLELQFKGEGNRESECVILEPQWGEFIAERLVEAANTKAD